MVFHYAAVVLSRNLTFFFASLLKNGLHPAFVLIASRSDFNLWAVVLSFFSSSLLLPPLSHEQMDDQASLLSKRGTTFKCYRSTDRGTAIPGEPCGDPSSTSPFVPCCSQGDTCLAENLCRVKQADIGSNPSASEYYVAFCSDPSWSDSVACSTHCCKSFDVIHPRCALPERKTFSEC